MDETENNKENKDYVIKSGASPTLTNAGIFLHRLLRIRCEAAPCGAPPPTARHRPGATRYSSPCKETRGHT